MAIPVNDFYTPASLGAGHIASMQDVTANSEIAGAAIEYGQAVTLTDGKAVPATAAPIYGIAIQRGYMNADRFAEVKTDTWLTGEALGVLRSGTIAVPISADVDKGDGATIDADGKFKPIADGETPVGIFTSAGNSGDTAFLQTSLAFTSAVGSTATPAASSDTPAS